MLTQEWRIRVAFAVVLVCGTVLVGTRTPVPLAAASEVVFRIGGDIERLQQWTLDDLAALPRREVRARDRDGTEATFAGVALIELLRLAGVPVGEKLRGSNMALYLLVEAADGYRVVFALPELDPAFRERVVLLADHRDGQPLSTAEGPLRLVVPDEKRHARWVRQVGSCTVRRARDPCCPWRCDVLPESRYPGLAGRRETPD
jgi:DMSO/TMAO reductase YedYZ molybdopterin-dependent catalytic subunit